MTETTNFIGQITNASVIDAVDARFMKRRSFSEHWDRHMSVQQKAAFSDSLAAFIEACVVRQQWLAR